MRRRLHDMNIAGLKFAGVDHLKKYQQRYLIFAFMVCGLWAIFADLSSKSGAETLPRQDKKVSVANLIPPGYTLMPIPLLNAEELGSMLDGYGKVSLFSIPDEGPKRLVARSLKIIRSPINPSVFGVLVRQNDTEILLKFPGPYYAVLESLSEENARVEKAPSKNPVQVSYQE
ncbi:MAG: hypothetical protein N2578_05090 [Bdellovibrionaceae bacterium]|nr:hypothetical protein [Pseudobdellovibrionaceae bacterium]